MKAIFQLLVLSALAFNLQSCGLNDESISDVPPPLDPSKNYLRVEKIAQGIALKSDGTLAYAMGVGGYMFDGKIDNIKDITPYGVVVKNDGTVWRLLDSASHLNPFQMEGFSDVKEVAYSIVGYMLALKNDGTVWAIGTNDHGQLGDNTFEAKSKPIQIESLSGIVSIRVGISAHSIALKNDGTIWGWGFNTSGELGPDGLGTNVKQPQQIPGFENIVSISAGNATTYGVKSDGTAWACGNNAASQLGTGTTGNTAAPLAISGLTDVKEVVATNMFAIALKNDSTVWSWGFNSSGSLGDGTTKQRGTPVKVKYLKGIKYINVSSFALEKDGLAWAWGDNSYGQLGVGTFNTVVAYPVRMEVK